MKRQRGFSLLGLAIGAAAVVALAIAAKMAWEGFKDDIGKPYQEAQRVADLEVTKGLDAEIVDLKTKVATSEHSYAGCRATLTLQTTSIKDAEQATKDAQEDTHKQALIATAAKAKAAASQDALAKVAGAAPMLQACEKELAEADAISRAGARSRQEAP